MPDVHSSRPTECILWRTENLSIEFLRAQFEVITIYEDDSHLIRKLLRCKECGHLYFHEFYEEIDWREGNDAQYVTWIPVADPESGKVLSTQPPIALLSYASIRYDTPMGAEAPTGPYWSCSRDTGNPNT